jgi:carbon storage regulator CsrA
MILISRQVDQAVVIGEGIVVRVIEIDRYRVRLSILGPGDCSVRKEERPDVELHARESPAAPP